MPTCSPDLGSTLQGEVCVVDLLGSVVRQQVMENPAALRGKVSTLSYRPVHPLTH